MATPQPGLTAVYSLGLAVWRLPACLAQQLFVVVRPERCLAVEEVHNLLGQRKVRTKLHRQHDTTTYAEQGEVPVDVPEHEQTQGVQAPKLKRANHSRHGEGRNNKTKSAHST